MLASAWLMSSAVIVQRKGVWMQIQVGTIIMHNQLYRQYGTSSMICMTNDSDIL